MDDAKQIATVMLRLVIENNSNFTRGKKRAKENIERYCLKPYGSFRLPSQRQASLISSAV